MDATVILASVIDELVELRLELRLANAFYKIVVKERDWERARVRQLVEQVIKLGGGYE